MIRKIRKAFEETRSKKRHDFDDFNSLVEKCLKHYPQLFPNKAVNKDGSRVVYHLNAGELDPISLEKVHGSREYLPFFYAKLAITCIDDLITYIETNAETVNRRDAEISEKQDKDKDKDKDYERSTEEDNVTE